MTRPKNNNLKPVSQKKQESGYDKTKRRRKQKEEDAKLAEVAAKHFKKLPDEPQSSSISNEKDGAYGDNTVLQNPVTSNAIEDETSQENQKISEPFSSDVAYDDCDHEDVINRKTEEDEHCAPFDKSDPSTWTIPLPNSTRTLLLIDGPQQKRLNVYPNNGKFAFNPKHFVKVSTAKEDHKSEWLMYSSTTNSLFCFSCCLFGSQAPNTVSPWKNYGTSNVGFTDFGHQSRGILTHEESQHHFESTFEWKRCKKVAASGKSLNVALQEEYKTEVSFWKDVLRSIFEAVMFLAKNNLAFQGTSNTLGSKQSGNFLSLIELLSHYHPPLALHIDRIKKGTVSYMSWRTQTEFIGLAAESVRSRIIQNIKERKYFSIFFDATPDSAHQEQISQVIRTVRIAKNKCTIEENFIDFIHFDEKTGVEITEAILEKLQKDGLAIKNCRGQGYDNGSNMAGIYKGVQVRIKLINPLAEFIPCPAHSLNLVGHNAAMKVLPAKLILGQIQNLFVFFSGSPKRWTILKRHVKKTLKSQSATRWSSKAVAVLTLFEEFCGIAEALIEIINLDDAQTLADANSNFNLIYNFKFLLGVVIWDFILSRIQITNLALQKLQMDIQSAHLHLNGLVDWLSDFRTTGFQKSYEKAKEKADDVGISEDSGFEYRVTRSRLPARYRNNPVATTDIQTPSASNLDRFKTEFFDADIQKLSDEFSERFQAIRQISSDFSFLWGTKLDNSNALDLVKSAMNLAIKYSDDIDGACFVKEVEYLKSAIRPFLTEAQTLSNTDALQILNILTMNKLDEQFLYTCSALRIFFTMPVTVASNERSFSKLKIIKNHMRSSMGQERLSNLAILSIEHETVSNMSFDTIIDAFATAKCRKVPK